MPEYWPSGPPYWPIAATLNAGDARRQRIIDVLDARLRDILIAEGYKTDAGESVFAWELYGLDASQLPALTYRDVSDTPDQATIGRVDNFLTIDIAAMAARSAAGEAQVRNMIADVIKAVGVDETWDGLAEDTELIPADLDAEAMEKNQFGSALALVIEYSTGRFDAF